nr:DUF1573 domain-containing protein [uncultured Prevotella sp.]
MVRKLTFVLMASACLLCGCKKEPAMLMVSTNEVDFGTFRLMDGMTKHVDIECENTGDKTLRFKPVFTDCNCTTVTLPADSLEGGEKMTIGIDVNYIGFRPGAHHSTVKLFTNSKGGPEEIVLKSKIIPNQ